VLPAYLSISDVLYAADVCYRVQTEKDTGWVTIVSLGIKRLDAIVKDTYIPFEGLPDWFQGRLAVLSLLENDAYLEGVGHKAGDNEFYSTFWVIEPSNL